MELNALTEEGGHYRPSEHPESHTPSLDEVIADRRRQVAALRLRGLSLYEILKQLPLPPINCVNQANGRPWSKVTIHNDLVALEAEWRAEAAKDTATLKTQVLSELRELRRAAWGKGKDGLRIVAQTLQQEAKLMGLDAPIKIAGLESGDALQVRLEGLSVEQLTALAGVFAGQPGAAIGVGADAHAGAGPSDGPAHSEAAG